MEEKDCPNQLLRQCAEKLEGHWVQGHFMTDSQGHARGDGYSDYGDPDSLFCAVGVLRHISRKYNYNQPAIDRAVARLASIIPILTSRTVNEKIIHWNDKEYQTEKEVVDAFKRAAELP